MYDYNSQEGMSLEWHSAWSHIVSAATQMLNICTILLKHLLKHFQTTMLTIPVGYFLKQRGLLHNIRNILLMSFGVFDNLLTLFWIWKTFHIIQILSGAVSDDRSGWYQCTGCVNICFNIYTNTIKLTWMSTIFSSSYLAICNKTK